MSLIDNNIWCVYRNQEDNTLFAARYGDYANYAGSDYTDKDIHSMHSSEELAKGYADGYNDGVESTAITVGI